MEIDKVPDDFITHAIMNMKASPQHFFLILTKRAKRMAEYVTKHWPEGLPNIFWGCTAENQQRADERIPYLLQVPGKRWLSIEPLLSKIDLTTINTVHATGNSYHPLRVENNIKKLHQVVVGCETGRNARPCKVEWIESIIDQCRQAGVPCFVKAINLNGKITSDITKFPESVRVRELIWKKELAWK